MPSKNISCVCVYKMVDIKAETQINKRVAVINIHENGNASKALLKLLCISDIAKKWGDKNIYDLIDKEIKGKYMIENMNELTKPQIRKYKIGKTRLFKNNKHSMYVHEVIAIRIIMQSNLELIWDTIKSI